MPRRLARRLGLALERAPWLDIEFYSGCCALGWSLISLFGHQELTDRPAWTWLGQVLSPPLFEIVGATLGALQISALFSHGRLPRWVMAFAASCFWFLLTTSIIISDRTAPGIIMYFVAGIANLVAMGRAASGVR